jgi:hypothetical protein
MSAPVRWGWHREAALKALTQLPADLIPLALDAASHLQDDEGRADVLAILVPKSGPEQRQAILQLELDRLRAIRDDNVRDEVLARLVPCLRPEERSNEAMSSMEVSTKVGARSGDFTTFAGLLPYLPPDTATSALDRALDLVTQIPNDRVRAQALVSLAPLLPDSAIPRVLGLVEQVNDEWARSQALGSLAPLLPDSAIPRVLELVAAMNTYPHRALAPLVERLHPQQRPDTVERIVSRLEEIAVELPGDLLKALPGIVAHLTDDQVDRIVRLIMEIQSVSIRTTQWLMPAALELSTNERRRALTNLATQKKHHVRPESLPSALAIEEDDRRAIALGKLLPVLQDDDRYRALDRMLRSCLGVQVTSRSPEATYHGIDRSFLLQLIAQTSPDLTVMGGESCASEIALAIRECGNWWP